MIQSKNIIDSGNIGEWVPSEQDMSGTLEWSNPNCKYSIYGTPHWMDEGFVPIAFSDEEGNYEDWVTYEIDGIKSIEVQLSEYRNKIAALIKIMNWEN
tara:strand:+ start:352 stop:645 length:294 start_codon:yes stop_codon:yes gene_type:complete